MALPLAAVPSICVSGCESRAQSSSNSDPAQSSSNNSNSESEPQYTIHIEAATPNVSSSGASTHVQSDESTAAGLSPLSHLHNDDVLQDDGSLQQGHKLTQLLLPPQSLNETTGDTHSLCGSEGELLSQASELSAESQDARLLGEFCIVEDEGSLAAHPVSDATTLSLLLPTPSSSSTHAHSGDVASPSTRPLDSPGVLVEPEHAEPSPVHVTARDAHASIERESKREVSPDLDEPVMAPASIATTVTSTTTNTNVFHPSAVSSSPSIISQPSLISTYQQALRSSFSDRDAISNESEADLLPSVLASDHKQLDRASLTQSPSSLSDVPLQPGDAWTGDNSALSSSSFSSPPSAATVERGITLRGSRARVQSLEVEDGDQQRQRAAALQRKALLDVDAREQCACGCIIL